MDHLAGSEGRGRGRNQTLLLASLSSSGLDCGSDCDCIKLRNAEELFVAPPPCVASPPSAGWPSPGGGASSDCLSRNILCSQRFTTSRASLGGRRESFTTLVSLPIRDTSPPHLEVRPPRQRDLITKCHQLRLSIITFHHNINHSQHQHRTVPPASPSQLNKSVSN